MKMKDPMYDVLVEILEEDTRKNFVKFLLENGVMDFKSLYTDYLKVSETNSRHHLKLLLDQGIVQKEKQKGTKAMFLRITPSFIERVRRYFGVERKYAYIGMVGQDSPGTQAKQAIQRIRSNKWLVNTVTIFTTENIKNVLEETETWLGMKSEFAEAILIPTPLIDFDKTYEVMKQVIEKLIHQYSLVADVTGLTKIHTLAMYILAKDYGLERVYLPKEETDRVIILP